MADWTNIANTTLEPDAPLTSATMLALRDNPKAIAEGAVGAPRVENAGIAADSLDAGKTLTVKAGDVVRFSTFSQEFDTSSTSYTTVVDERILNPGTIRVMLDHAAADTSTVQVLVNGSVVQTFTKSGAGLQTQAVDVNITRNARVQIRHKTEGGLGTLANIRFKTSGGSLWPGAAGFVY